MVAVVSGNGLGLFNTSLTQLGTTWGGQAGIGQSRESQLVNIATGNLILQDQDENLAVRGFNTGLLRTYNSQGTVTGAGQDGFVTGYERNVALTGTLNAAGSTMTLNTGDGQTQVFTYTSTNVYTSTAGDGAHDTLTWASATSTWTLVEGSTRREEQYANHADAVLKGRLIRIRDLTSDSTTPAEFDVLYNANNLVSEVRSIDGAGASADAILFGYDTTFPTRLVAVATREGGVIKSQLWYEYDTYGRLSAVTTDLAPTTEASVLTARAGTDVWNATASLNNGNLFRTSYTYAAASATDLRIASVTQSDGTVVSYTYETNTPGARIKTVTLGDTNINDADGAGETVTFTYGTNTTDVTDSLGRVWTYKYDASKQLTEVDAPAISGLRDVTTYTYDAAGNVTQVKAVRGATVLSQMDYTYDANGNQTMQWDAAGNAVQRWFNLNTNQVTTENAYFNVDPDRTGPTAPTGAMTTRYIYDAQNRLRFTWSPLGEVTEYTYATSGNGIGQRASARMYLGATYTGGVFAETDLANWATTAQKTNSTLVEYTYDAKGRLSQTTSYASVDGTTGAGTFDTATDISRFTYDAHGMLLQQVSVRGASRTLTGTAPNGSEVIDYVYDGLGRLLSVLKRDMSRAPLTSRPDPVTNPVGYAAWDAVTQLTTYAYNDSGKQIVVTFDTADAVDATTGAIYTDRTRTQTQTFNAAHRLLSVADVGTTADLIANTSSTVTRTSQYYYDSAGQLRATQDAAGGRHYYFYDAKGLLAGDVDATGAVTEYTRDGAGRVIDTIGYSTRVDTSTWLSGSTVTQSDIAAIRPGWSTDFASLPITGLNTSQVDNPTYANVMQYQSASGRLAFITQYSATTINANIQRNPATLHALTENISYRGEISTGATQNNTYLLFSLQNTQPVGSTLRRTSIYFRNGNLYLNNQIGTVGSNTLIGATAANTTYVVEARTRDGVIEYTVYAKGTDPSTGWTVSTEADPADWGSIKLVVSGHAASDMTLGDALYLDNLSESDLGVRHNTRTYDSAGRLATSTDAAGTVTTYTYDGASRLLQTKTTDAAGTAATARTTRYFYDADNRQVATLDAAGYFSETIYDLGGRAIKTIRYATQSNSTYWASGTTGQLRPGVVASLDQTTRYYYNGRGQQVGVLNAEGYLTEYVYDEANNQRASKAYAKPLTGTDADTLATLRTAATVTPPVPTEPFRLTQRTFNGLGQLIKEVNPENTVTFYSYDDAGRLVRTEAAQGTSEVRESFRRYDVFDQLIGEISGQQAAEATADATLSPSLGGKLLNDPSLSEAQLNAAYNKYGITHSYDLVGRRTESVDALGNKTWYFYDAQGRQTYLVRGVAQDNAGVTGVANSYGEVTETRYSAFGEVLDSIAYTGRIAIASPYDRNSVSTAIGALMFASATDTRRQYSYDTRGLLSRTIDAEGTVNRYTYTAFGQLDTETRAAGTSATVTIDHTYDNRGLETGRIDAVGVSGVQRSVSQTYDAFGRVVTAIDGRGTPTTYTYDRLGRQLSHSQLVEGQTELWQTAYDAFNHVVSQTDPLNRTTRYSCVDSTRTVTVTTPEGIVVSTVHNRFGQTATVTDGTGAVTTFTYDKNGALTQTSNALGQTNTNTYDVRGLLVRTTDATGRIVDYTYDAVGRVLQRIEDVNGLHLTTSYVYDAQGRKLSVADASGRMTTMTYDQEGRLLTQALDPSGLNLRTNYTWDAAGRQLTVVEAAGTTVARTTQYIYDALGRRTSEILDPGAGKLNLTTTYSYDADNNVIGRTDATGNLTRYAYDEANHLRFAVDAEGGVSETNYDADGRVTQTRQYVTAIALSSLASSWTLTQVSALVIADTRDQVNYRAYDQDGRLTAMIDGVGGVTTYTYDAANRVIANMRYANAATLTNLVAPLLAGTATVAGVVAALTTNAASDQPTTFTYDAAGRLLRRTDAAGNVTRTVYDAAGRTVYSIDPLGNFTRNWYDMTGRLTATRQFDAAFNTATINDSTTATQLDALLDYSANDLGQYFVYDASGRLRYTIDLLCGLTESTYDSAGRQVSSRSYLNAVALDSAMYISLFAGTAYDSLVAPTANNTADRESRSVYDELGQLRYSLTRTSGSTCSVTEYRFDAAGRTVANVAYNVSIPSTTVATTTAVAAAITTAGGNTAANQQLTRYVYDAAGRLRFSLNDIGAVSERIYDGAGRMVEQRSYQTAIPTSTAANESAVLAALDAAEQSVWNTDLASASVTGLNTANVGAYGNALTYESGGASNGRLVFQTVNYASAAFPSVYRTQTHAPSENIVFSSELTTDSSLSTTWFLYGVENNLTGADYRRAGIQITNGTLYRNEVVGTTNTNTAIGTLAANTTYVMEAHSREGGVDYYVYAKGSDKTTGFKFTVDETDKWDNIRLRLWSYARPGADGNKLYVDNLSETVAPSQHSSTRYDGAGRVLAVTDSLGNTETYSYDASGRQVTRTDALGNVWTMVYDAAGRLRYSLAPNSATTLAVTERRYNALGQVIAEVAYATAIPNGTTATVAAVIAALKTAGGLNASTGADIAAQQHMTRYVYNDAGQLRFTIDDAGAVSERIYDGLGRVVEDRSYQTLIPTSTAATESAVLAALDTAEQTQWSSNLGSLPVTGLNTDAVGQYGNALTYDPNNTGRLVFQVTNSASTTFPNVYRTQTHAPSENVVFSGELTTGASLSTTYFTFGIENDLTGANYRRSGFQVTNGTLFKKELVGTTNTSTTLGTLAINTTYVMEAHSREGGVDYFVYVKGTDKSTGFQFTVETADQWDAIRLKMWSYTRPGTDGNPLYVDNLSESVAASHHTSTRYDNAGRVLSVTDSLGNTESYTYNALGQRIQRTDKLGNVWTMAYDAAGRVVSETSPQVSVASVDDAGVVTLSTRAIVTQTAYDALGNVITRTEDATGAHPRITRYEYDAVGQQVRTIFPDAGVINSSGVLVASGVTPDTVVTYDALGHAVVQKDVLGNYSYKVYDLQGRVAYDIDAEGYVTAYSYDALGQQTGLTRFANKLVTTGTAFTSAGWNATKAISLAQAQAGVAASVGDRTLTNTFDARGNKVSVKQSAVAYYDVNGVYHSGASAASPETRFVYDAYGQAAKESLLIDATNNVWADTYHYFDDLGRETMSVDAEGYVTTKTYDALGQITTQTEYARAIATSGLTTTAKPALPAAGNATIGFDRISQFTYDALGRKSSVSVRRTYTQADSTTAVRDVATTFTYDANDHLLTTTVDGVLNTTLAYDALGRAVSVQEAQRDVLRSDAESSLTNVANDLAGTAVYERSSPFTALTYDAFGNTVRQIRYANGLRTGEQLPTADATRDQVNIARYDWQGRAVMSVDGEGNKTYSNYDASDRVSHQWHALRGSTAAYDAVVHQYFVYNNAGNQIESRVERAVGAAAAVVERDQFAGYNAFGEIVAQGITQTDLTNPAASIQCTYDLAGHLITSNSDAGTPRTFGYDLAGRQVYEQRYVSELINGTPTTVTETYRQVTDRLGRNMQTILPSNTSDRNLTSTVLHTFDRWGNTLTETDPRGYLTRYEYNEQNQKTRQIAPQVQVVGEDGMVSLQSPETHWMYDALGRLTATSDANGNVRQNVYNEAGQIIRIVDGTGAITRQGFDALGNARINQNALGYLTWQAFDRVGRVTAHGDYLPDITGTARQSYTLEQFTLSQDGHRVVVTTAPDTLNTQTKYDYDGDGQLLHSQSAMGVPMTYVYDVQGRKVRETDGVGGVQTWTYDVFGRVTAHTDLSNKTYTYTYDSQSGQLIHEISGWGADRYAAYFANGQISRITEGNNWYVYQYDANGNRTYEETLTVDGGGQQIRQRTSSTYDSNNRLVRVLSEDLNVSTGSPTMTIVDVKYGYDAVGNRRVVVADSGYGNNVTAPSTITQTVGTTYNVGNTADTRRNYQASWYTYDGENRTVVHNGVLTNGQILLSNTGYTQLYDAVGNATTQISLTWNGTYNQSSTYNLRGQVTMRVGSEKEVNTYDDAGHLTETRRYYGQFSVRRWIENRWEIENASGILREVDQMTYDDDGRLLTQATHARDSDSGWEGALEFELSDSNTDDAARLRETTDLSVLTLAKANINYTGRFDNAGRVTGYTYSQAADGANPAFTWTYTYAYQGRDTYLENTIGGSGTGNYRATISSSTYDAYGRRTAVTETTKISGNSDLITQRYFANDGASGILSRRDGQIISGSFVQAQEGSTQFVNPVPKWIDATTWSSYSKAQREAVVAQTKNQRFAYVNGQLIAQADQAGAKLDALSRLTAYSNSDIGSSKTIVLEGDTLQLIAQRVYGNEGLWYVLASANAIDNDGQLVAGTELKVPQVKVSQNDATTFKPYDPNEIIGPTSPSLPYIAPPKCEGLSKIISYVVQAIVSAYIPIPVLSEAAGAAAGNLAYQYSQMMFNGQYDWTRYFRLHANPASGNLSDWGRWFYDPLGQGAPGKADYTGALIAGGVAAAGSFGGPLGAIASYSADYQLNRLAGRDPHWNNRQLGANVSTAIISQALGLDGGGGGGGGGWAAIAKQFASEFGKSVVRSGIQYEMNKAWGVDQSAWNWKDVAIDAFGNALGNAVVRGIQYSRSARASSGTQTFGLGDDAAPATVSQLPPDEMGGALAGAGDLSLSSYDGDNMAGAAGGGDSAGMLGEAETDPNASPGTPGAKVPLSNYEINKLWYDRHLALLPETANVISPPDKSLSEDAQLEYANRMAEAESELPAHVHDGQLSYGHTVRQMTGDEINQMIANSDRQIYTVMGATYLAGISGGAAALSPLAGAALSGWSIGSGLNDVYNGNYVTGGIEIAAGALGLGLSASQVRSATTLQEALWMPLGARGIPGQSPLLAEIRSWDELAESPLSRLNAQGSRIRGADGQFVMYAGVPRYAEMKFQFVEPPVANRVDGFIADVHRALRMKMNSAELAQFKAIDPSAKIGLTGSSATGRVGNPNKPTFGQPINMEKFDLDLFVQSDVLLGRFGQKLVAAPNLRQSLIDDFPGLFQGLKPGKEGLSIKFRPHGEPPKGSIIFDD